MLMIAPILLLAIAEDGGQVRVQFDPHPGLCLTYVGQGRGKTCKKSGHGLPCPDG